MGVLWLHVGDVLLQLVALAMQALWLCLLGLLLHLLIRESSVGRQ